MKKCKKCNQEKEIILFYNNKRYSDGLYPICKSCESKRVSDYYKCNQEKQKKKRSERYKMNNIQERERKRLYDNNNRDIVNKRARDRYKLNKDYAKDYYKNNKESIRIKNNNWIENNKEHFKELNRKNSKRWLKRNPHVVAWRQMLYRTIKKFNQFKSKSTNEMLGYSADDLKYHIESLFEIGMTWENWGEWHIDHIIQIHTFDKETPVNIVNSLKNLRPLWAKDNLKRKRKD